MPLVLDGYFILWVLGVFCCNFIWIIRLFGLILSLLLLHPESSGLAFWMHHFMKILSTLLNFFAYFCVSYYCPPPVRFLLLHGLVFWYVFWCRLHLVLSFQLFLCGSFSRFQSLGWIFPQYFWLSTNCSIPFGDCIVEVLSKFPWLVHLFPWVFSMIINLFKHQDSELPSAIQSPICQYICPASLSSGILPCFSSLILEPTIGQLAG